MNRGAVVVVAALAMTGCHTMRFEFVDADHAYVVQERKSFWLFGWTPTRVIDVSEVCPSGAAAVKEETTFLDGFFGTITLGIWQPRTSWYYCLPEAME